MNMNTIPVEELRKLTTTGPVPGVPIEKQLKELLILAGISLTTFVISAITHKIRSGDLK